MGLPVCWVSLSCPPFWGLTQQLGGALAESVSRASLGAIRPVSREPRRDVSPLQQCRVGRQGKGCVLGAVSGVCSGLHKTVS